MSSQEPPPPADENVPELAPAPSPVEEKPAGPGEEWIEEYESEKKAPAPKKRRRGVLWAAVAVVVIVIIVLWTVMSPEVMPVVGGTYIGSDTYANLGSYADDVEVRWLFELVYVADTTWGVSVSGDQNVSAGQPATFHVLMTKVHESVKNPWFIGTSVDLKKVALYTEDGELLGSMVSESCEPFGQMAEVEATFDSPGEYECEVHVEMTINGKMVIGYLPVITLRITVDLDVNIIAS